MSIHTGCSAQDSVVSAVAEIKQQLQGGTPRLVIYFASPRYDPLSLSREMELAFAGTAVMGCSTAGEIISGKMSKGSIVAMSLGKDIVGDAVVEVVEGVSAETRVSEAFARFEEYFRMPMLDMDPSQYVGIILADGLSGAEERLMDAIGNLTDITFVGGSAGDDLQFKNTYVYAHGRHYTNAAVLAVIKPTVRFSFIKTQSCRVLDAQLVATEVNEVKREVVSFNGRPAAQVYAEALGTTVDAAATSFISHPVALMIGDEPYVRSPQQLRGDHMVFYCNILQGMNLRLLESTDIVADTKQAIQDKVQELGSISGLINFHCILRTLELEQESSTDAYAQLFSDIPTVGFSTYGEEYLGHMNQTSTMLVFA
jgi:hypothetical protein